MTYTANPADSTHPADTDAAQVAAAELRALKAYIATLSGLSQANFNFWTGFRQLLINGRGIINQEGLTSVTASGYIADNWQATTSVATITTTGANNAANNPSLTGGIGLNLSNGAVAKAVLAAADTLSLSTRVEGLNIQHLLWGSSSAKTLNLSFTAYASQATTIAVSVRNGANNRSYVTLVPLSAGFASYSITIPGDQTGTWTMTNTYGIALNFSAAIGSTNLAPNANVWAAGAYIGVAGMSNICDTANRNVGVSDVQLELGTVATPVEIIPWPIEFSNCQRYVEIGTTTCIWTAAGVGNEFRYSVRFKRDKRAVPTITLSGGTSSNLSAETVPNPTLDKFDHRLVAAAAGTVTADGRIFKATAYL